MRFVLRLLLPSVALLAAGCDIAGDDGVPFEGSWASEDGGLIKYIEVEGDEYVRTLTVEEGGRRCEYRRFRYELDGEEDQGYRYEVPGIGLSDPSYLVLDGDRLLEDIAGDGRFIDVYIRTEEDPLGFPAC